MTMAMIDQEFHGEADTKMPAHKLAEHRNAKIKRTFDNVCLRYKTDSERLLLMPSSEVASWVKSVDETLQVDESGVSAALKLYVQLTGAAASSR